MSRKIPNTSVLSHDVKSLMKETGIREADAKKLVENIKMEKNEAYMIVAELPFFLMYRLYLKESKKAIDLLYLSSPSIGTIVGNVGIQEFADLESAIPTASNTITKEKIKLKYKIKPIQLNEDELKKISKIERLFLEEKKEEFFDNTKSLLGPIYKRMNDRSKYKDNRLKVCFGIENKL